MGGLITIKTILQHPWLFSGTVLIAPVIIPAQVPASVLSQIAQEPNPTDSDKIVLPLNLNDISHDQVRITPTIDVTSFSTYIMYTLVLCISQIAQ